MHLDLDAESQQCIQQELALGHYREPSEVVAHALSLLAAQQHWFALNKQAINHRLEESLAQADRGELYTPEQALALLEERRAQRAQ